MPRRRHRSALRSLAALAWAGPLACAGPEPARELVLLLSVDTLRADRLGSYGSELGLTPRLDQLAAESMLFEAAYAPASLTLPSLAALHLGRYPEQIGVLSNASRIPPLPTLASELRARGFATGAVVSNVVLREGSGLDAGFDRYDAELAEEEAVRRWPERIAPETTRAALRTLDQLLATSAPQLFLWVHYQDPHGPYTPPGELRLRSLEAERRAPDAGRRLPLQPSDGQLGALPTYQALGDEREVAFYRAGYDGEVRFTDAAIGELLDGVAARGLQERALIVFTADHGESLGEGDYWFAHGAYLSDPLVRVPLLIRAPGIAAERRPDVASLVDLYPTLVPLAARGRVPPFYPGRNLLAQDARRILSLAYFASLGGSRLPRIGIARGDYKYLAVLRGGSWQGTLTRRLASGLEEPLASAPLEESMGKELAATRERLGRLPPETRQELGPEELARLEALGYAAGEAPAEPAQP
jgi:arylsulfatase